MRRSPIAVLIVLLAVEGVRGAEPGVDVSGTGPSTSRLGPRSVAHLSDAREVRRRLGLIPEYELVSGVESIKIAVLDYGFDGLDSGRPYLPAGAEVVEHYDPEFVRRHELGDPDYRKAFEPTNTHGRWMAQIVWAVTGSRPDGPKFFLLNANGPTMLRRAVAYAVDRKVDVILFSGSFEGGGDGDGEGPINRIVDEATDAGILWINAAGNYGGRVYNGPVRILSDGFLRLRDQADIAALRFRNHLDENTITITLNWNDYRGEEDAGTDKDLDLIVEDWAGRVVGSSRKVQVSGDREAGPDESRNPRERVVLTNLPSIPELPDDPDYGYRIRVWAKAGAFDDKDRVRILVTAARDRYLAPGRSSPSDALEFFDASERGEIYPPADHPRVFTVGDRGPSSSVGPTEDGRRKPDAILDDSRAYFTDGEVTAGSSNAAAYVAGVVAVLKAAEPSLSHADLIRFAQRGPTLATRADDATAKPAPSPPRTVRVIGPDGRTVSYLTLGATTNADASSTRTLHAWKTPTRSELADLVRRAR